LRNTKGANLTHPIEGTAKRPPRDTPSRAPAGARFDGLWVKNSRFFDETAAKAALNFIDVGLLHDFSDGHFLEEIPCCGKV
jgi:hypothetical protein